MLFVCFHTPNERNELTIRSLLSSREQVKAQVMSAESTESDRIITAVRDVIGSATIPVPQLITLIATYALPFTVHLTQFKTSSALEMPFSLCYVKHQTASTESAESAGGDAASTAAEYFIVAEPWNQRFMKVSIADGSVQPFVMNPSLDLRAAKSLSDGSSKSVGLNVTFAACVDRARPMGEAFYLGEASTIRYYDSIKDTVTVIAGGLSHASVDGIGLDVRFVGPTHLLCTSDGSALFITDSKSNSLRRLDARSRQVLTVMIGSPYEEQRAIVWDCSPHVNKSESAIWIGHTGGITRFEVETRSVEAFTLTPTFRGMEYQPHALICTPTGPLIIGCRVSRGGDV